MTAAAAAAATGALRSAPTASQDNEVMRRPIERKDADTLVPIGLAEAGVDGRCGQPLLRRRWGTGKVNQRELINENFDGL